MANLAPLFLNNVATALAALAAVGDTTFTVTAGDGAKFGTIPAQCFIPAVVVDTTTNPETVKEFVYITAVAGDVLTVTRAAESAATYPAAARAAGLALVAVASGAALQQALNLPVWGWVGATTIPAYTLVQLPTGGLAFQTAQRQTRASFDATERTFWTFLPGGHYEKFTSSTTWVVPTGITQCRARIIGAGGGGGGGGSAALTSGVSAQCGGAGAGAGAVTDLEVTGETPGTSRTVTIGAAGTGGAGGAASVGVTGNSGSNGTNGGRSSIVLAGTTFQADGGQVGTPGQANNTASVGGGIMGAGQAGLAYTMAVTAYNTPGGGGNGQNGIGVVGTWAREVCGGEGGGPATAILGGLAGAVLTSVGSMPNAGQSGHTAGLAGGDGSAQTIPGCGGVGGGGGAPGGKGGNGAAGAAGQVELWY